MKAKIKDNKAYCPICGKSNYMVTDYQQTGEGTLMTVLCKDCHHEFEYILNASMECNKRSIEEEQ